MRALTLLVVVLCAVPALAQRSRARRPTAQPPKVEQPAPAPDPVQLRYPKLIEIDPLQVTGQQNKAGGVYLYDRKPLPNKSMVHERESFREELYGTL